jgi:hypothetical protein
LAVADDADGLGGNIHAADRHPIATDAAAHETFGAEQEEHDDDEDKDYSTRG